MVEKFLAEKFEGKLFVDICLMKIFGNSYTINKDYYTVLHGIVYMVNDGTMQKSGDSLLSLKTNCKMIGKFDSTKLYKRVQREYTYAEFKKIHRL